MSQPLIYESEPNTALTSATLADFETDMNTLIQLNLGYFNLYYADLKLELVSVENTIEVHRIFLIPSVSVQFPSDLQTPLQSLLNDMDCTVTKIQLYKIN